MNSSQTHVETSPEETKNVSNRQLILFEIAAQQYAFFIEEVSEVLATPLMSKIPLAPSYMKGLANVRGNIFTLLDLEERFELEKKPMSQIKYEYPFTLLLNSPTVQIGILLRQVPDTLEVSEESIDMTPLLVREDHTDKSYVKGIIRHQQNLILLLDSRELTEDIKSK